MKQVFLFLCCSIVVPALLYGQQTADTNLLKKDSLPALQADSLTSAALPDTIPVDSVSPRPSVRSWVLLKNKFLNSDDAPVSFSVRLRKENNKESSFYLIAGIVLILASLKYLYNRYFTNLFRVFFNTSLRQSQLTDQLLQAKLPSLLFNMFFVLSGGMYIYILLLHYGLVSEEKKWFMIFFSTVLLGLVYFIKFCTLKFTGWVTGLADITNIYVFIIFLINKIIGIFLVPFIVILSFSDPAIAKVAVIISLMSIGIFLLLRFFRSYGLLQNQLKISRFHFLLYIAGIELLPLLLVYKGLMVYLSKNL